ncbi:polyketide synthase of type I [Kordia algicida OT-1]|uniref:Polyketide synthase of type I n=1 Tax=Kordia algicida OT-1 TaxID=391587 RepID=A9EAA7_9FLAO|nr:SDR family NAD(P)-dependent oxidoreductase [Kordia algicida]EDP94607.1 polyketide synthase of type I [Kordia algicida OT-1]
MISEKYLNDLRSAITEIFNQSLNQQPQIIVNLGCKDGTVLREIYQTISGSTLRGKYLKEHPVQCYAVDASQENLDNLALDNKNIQTFLGDIQTSNGLKKALKNIGISSDKKILYLHTVTPTANWQAYLQVYADHLQNNQLLFTSEHVVAETQASLDKNQITTEKFITLAANIGLFTEKLSKRYPDSKTNKEVALHNITKRAYSIRNASLKDLQTLDTLEELCWQSHIRSSKEAIQQRIKTFPQGQFVLEKNGEVVGVIYSQAINDKAQLEKATMDNVHKLHNANGNVMQLLAVNIHPSVQLFNYGDQLLEFMLQRCSLINKVTEIVAVSICKNYDKNGEYSFEEYLNLQGEKQDPIMAFHHNHGANIVKGLANYRERDTANEGFGVLVHYTNLDERINTNKAFVASPETISKNTSSEFTKKETTQKFITETIANLLNINTETVDEEQPLMEMGLNSVDLQMLQRQIEKKINQQLEAGFFFEYNTVLKVAEKIQADFTINNTEKPTETTNTAKANVKNNVSDTDIAIIGISCKLPGNITSVDALWEALTEEKSLISSYPKERGNWANSEEFKGIDQGGFMQNAAAFDASFFRISPKEAQITDPQQRILLELAWACLEDAGIPAKKLIGSNTGVFVGASNADYSRKVQDAKLAIEAHHAVGSSLAILANRLSYYFDLSGPSLLVDTACSSSLVAIHSAVQSLHSGECDSAIVGGVNFICHPDLSIAYHKAGMLSPEAKCKVFDSKANGYVRGEGTVVMLLKPLKKAIEDKNQIHGVIKGSAINHGGLAAGLTVPNPKKQSELLVNAWKNANISTSDLSYIEAHGTGTSLGDPIEVQGIKNALTTHSDSKTLEKCTIGSIKSNVGHLESAAGMTGMLKVILAMKHKQLPASIHFSTLNPKINLNDSPIQIQNTLTSWQSEKPLLAGVSSFGSGGTNGHVVLEEFQQKTKQNHSTNNESLFVLSAKNEDRLIAYAEKIIRWIDTSSETFNFNDAIYSWQVGRTAMKKRLAIQATNFQDLKEKLSQWIAGKTVETTWSSSNAATNYTEEIIAKAISEKNISLLGQIWTTGATINWEAYYANQNDLAFVSLPTYPFAKDHYWIQETETITETKQPTKTTNSKLYATPTWKAIPIENIAESNSKEVTETHILLCGFSTLLSKKLSQELPETTISTINSKKKKIAKTYTEIAVECFEEIQQIVREKSNKKIDLWIVVPALTTHTTWLGLSGMLQTLHAEYPSVSGQVLAVNPKIKTPELTQKLLENQSVTTELTVKYDANERKVIRWEAIQESSNEQTTVFKDEGVYILTGGLGGLGTIFIKEIGKQTKNATIIITGRSELTADKQEKIKQLATISKNIHYHKVTLTSNDEVKTFINSIKEKHGNINGIIHCAGMVKDNFIIKKTASEFEEVLQPKVAGTIHLDEATKNENLDFFVLFSSIFSVVGNVGQADYATANGFMDQFAAYRNTLLAQKERAGQTLSINWPFWKDGGMDIHESSLAIIKEETGMIPMETATGLHAFYQGIANKYNQLLVMEGVEEKLVKTLENLAPTNETIEQAQDYSVENQDVIFEKTLQKTKELFGEVLGFAPSKVDEHESFSAYGIDSIFINQLNQKLSKTFDSLSKTIFFEHQTLHEITNYLVNEYTETCASWTQTDINQTQKGSSKIFKDASKTGQTIKNTDEAEKQINHKEPIAIIGISGIYPEAKDLDEFWENLQEGKNSISEIPPSRWSLDDFYEPDMQKAVKEGKSYAKWGGFINEFAQFDPMFFGISPREALNIDPHERLFLQESWRALESSGYTKHDLKQKYHQKVGVFAGVTKTGFELKAPFYRNDNHKFHPRSSFSSVANRLSYVLDIKGPSMPIDTMCSSSLTAIHEACEHIHRGECEVAFAGGVNLYLHPSTYSYLSSQHMLSVDGQCKSFGLGGNGFVPGEGVGVVLLKPLSEAVKDNDVIHGVILSTHVNHGGKTNGYTVPSPVSQSQLIKTAIKKAGINARDISYIEAHGTGTELGDPIEVEGLKKAFDADTTDKNYCAIGSVKSNIGHLEAAAGISGLTKVLLQMKHGKIVPSLHTEDLNPNIDFEKTAFQVATDLQNWERPFVQNEEKPRIAGISSFGAGGANAHVILQEYQPQEKASFATESLLAEAEKVLIPLSARNKAQLKLRAVALLDALRKNNNASQFDLISLTYTLQVGREAMDERLGFIVSSIEELEEKLIQYINEAKEIENFDQGNKNYPDKTFKLLTKEAEFQQTIARWVKDKKLANLLMLWVNGLTIDWHQFYDTDVNISRVALPTYPFANDEYWIQTESIEKGFTKISEGAEHINALLHHNTSNIYEQRYTSRFNGDEFFLKTQYNADEKITEKIVPTFTCIEMARLAALHATSGNESETTLTLQNLIWSTPFTLSEKKEINIALTATAPLREENIALHFDIFSESDGDETVHCQGKAVLSDHSLPQKHNIQELLTQLEEHTISNHYKGVQEIHKTDGKLVATIDFSEEILQQQETLILHPKTLSYIQNILAEFEHKMSNAYIIGCDAVQIIQPLQEEACIIISFVEESLFSDDICTLNIDICDTLGNVCVQFVGCSFGKQSETLTATTEATETEKLFFTPQWQETKVEGTQKRDVAQYHTILLDLPQIKTTQLETAIGNNVCTNISLKKENLHAQYHQYATACFEYIKNLQKEKFIGNQHIWFVIPNTEQYAPLQGVYGLLRTAMLENPKISGQILLTDAHVSQNNLAQQLNAQTVRNTDLIVKHENKKQYVFQWQQQSLQTSNEIVYKDQGIYVITGGLGGLGTIFCKEILQKTTNATVILTGRSELTQTKKDAIAKLKSYGGTVIYKSVNIADEKAVHNFFENVLKSHQQINGILHCAGMISDNFIAEKTTEEFHQVLMPKVDGTIYIDNATAEIELDFLVYFSSIAGAIGFVGQADYASANSFMDHYAYYRNGLVQKGKRHGKTLSINWPLWKDGGMGIDKATEKMVAQTIGMQSLATKTGLKAFYTSLQSDCSQSLVVEGNGNKIKSHVFNLKKSAQTTQDATISENIVESNYTVENTQETLKGILTEILGIQSSALSMEQTFVDMGLNSILGVELAIAINNTFGTAISNVIVYDYPNIKELSSYVNSHLLKNTSIAKKSIATISKEVKAVAKIDTENLINFGEKYPKLTRRKVTNLTNLYGNITPAYGYSTQKSSATTDDKIAIVGMSGKYPKAKNLKEYWNNLENGVDAVTEIPNSRWNIDKYYDPDPEKEGKIYAKWMGMLDEVDLFDPLFFKISPQEATYMDPEHRLFLQEGYKAFEDAGYAGEALKDIKCGVYLGLERSEYSWHLRQNNAMSPNVTSNNSAIAAARIAYFLNLKGPAITIDTACSSSLVAMHLACKSLLNNEIDMALTGGVRLWLGPETYQGMCQARMLSPDGKCKTFDDSANGFVPGEGVGAVVLKRLKDAEADNDNILGVILGSGINQDGKTNGITAPSVKSQIALEQEVYAQNNIDPSTITYVEAHGTGTKLGDPIELQALSTVFGESTDKKNYCALGSVKSNIGHTTAAAGIAGVHKVLLSLQNQTLAPTLHVTKENSHFDFNNSPFYVNTEKRVWKTNPHSLRRASVSSFGFSGTNSHLVIEEYPKTTNQATSETKSVIIPLSAKTTAQLKEKAADLLAFISEQNKAEASEENTNTLDLGSIAYTLQIGRDDMRERLGFVVNSIDQLENKLQAYLNGNDSDNEIYTGKATTQNDTLSLFSTDTDLQEAVSNWIQNGKLEKLLKLWVNGLTISWSKFYENTKPKRVSLPTYPFAKEKYWVTSQNGEAATNHSGVTATIHPLVHTNTSNLNQQSFTSTFSGNEFFLKEHLVHGKAILPGVAYLEMIRVAIEKSVPNLSDEYEISLQNIFWIRPLTVETTTEIEITVTPNDDATIAFEIVTKMKKKIV